MLWFYRYSFLLLVVFAVPTWAWGPLGHQAICDASWRLSTTEVRSYLAGAAKRMGYNTFAEACVWADHIRKQERYKWLAPLHYINVPKTATGVNSAKCLNTQTSKPSCVLTAITYYQQQLGNRSLAQKQRDKALLLLGHFVGDVHQPLHVSYAEDRGGTQRMVVFGGKAQSLHSLWDSDILYCAYSGGWRKLGKSLYRRTQTLPDQDSQPLDWANESLSLTRQIYQQLAPRLSHNYCQTYHPKAIERMELAAVRLTALLSASLE